MRKTKLLIPLFGFGIAQAQQMYIDTGGYFYLPAGIAFTTSNTVVNKDVNGVFAIQGGSTWATPTEYVNGSVQVQGAGVSIANTGNTQQSAMTITTQSTDNISCQYYKTAASVGTKDPTIASYKISDAEYWSVAKNSGTSLDVLLRNLTNTATTYEGIAPVGTPVLLRRDNSSSNWLLYSSNPGYGEFTFAVDSSLATNDFTLTGVTIYPNPLAEQDGFLNINLPESFEKVDMNIYAITGQLVVSEKNTGFKKGTNLYKKPALASGSYFVELLFNEGKKRFTKYILINQ